MLIQTPLVACRLFQAIECDDELEYAEVKFMINCDSTA